MLWEINSVLPYSGTSYRTRTAAFTGDELEAVLGDKSIEILASLDGETFSKIATVKGPTNRFVHAGLTNGWLVYYKAVAREASGEVWGESPVMMGAAGPNLFESADFEEDEIGNFEDDGDTEWPAPHAFKNARALRVEKGKRPYSDGTRVLAWDPKKAGVKQCSWYGKPVPISSGKLYLQGGWVKGLGDAWLGRWHFDTEKARTSMWSYAMMGVRGVPAWMFAVQVIEQDADDSALRIVDGKPYGMMTVAWKYPRHAGYFAPFVTAFDAGQADDQWLVEVTHAPDGATLGE